MSDTSQGDGWWVASDGKWYSPEQHPDYVAPVSESPAPGVGADTIVVPTPSTPTGPAFTAPGASVATPAGAATETFNAQTIADPQYNLPAADQPSSSKRSLILGVGALVLIAGLGFLAFRFFTSGSATGGADSPETAIGQLIDSINERDAVGFVDVFDPDEIEAWFGSFTPAFDQFEGVTDTGESAQELTEAYASLFESFDYSLTGEGGEPVTYQVEPLDDDGRISRVRIEGLDLEINLATSDTAVIAAFGSDASAFDPSVFDGTRAEFRDEPGGLAVQLFVPGEPAENDFAEGHMDLVTVQKDGKWFVSIGYTILETARSQGAFDDYPDPDFGRGFDFVDDQTGGSDSPEAVVQDMFTALETLSYESIIALTDPLATPYLHDYQPLIDSQVDQEDRRDAVRDAGLQIDDIELTTSEWQGRTLVTFDELAAQTRDAGSATLDTSNWCLTILQEGDRETVCADEGIAQLLEEADSDLDPRDFIPEETGFVVVERNGRWYLDALGTMGFFTDQLSEIGVTLSEEMQDNTESAFEDSPLGDLSGFFIGEGPIARQGTPVVQPAQSGTAAVALDVSAYPTHSNGFGNYHLAVARVVTDQSGTFLNDSQTPLEGEHWAVVYDQVDADPELAAIAASTEGQLDVELFDVTVTEVGVDGFSGQLGGQGRPQVFSFSSEASFLQPLIDGVTAQNISRFDSNGVIFDAPSGTSPFVSADELVVVTGEPGAVFSLSFEPTQGDEPPTPDNPPVDSGTYAPFVANDAFVEFVADTEFLFVDSQPGGFFDGCGGPNDPDVTSFIYDDGAGELIVFTSYPSFDRAVAAFDQLANIASPCEAFTSIEVNEVVPIDINNIRIEWQSIDDPDSVTFEHYVFSGSSVVVASGPTVESLEDQLELLQLWGN